MQRREDYYSGEGDEGGVWLGTGAGRLGASGSVDEDGLTCRPTSDQTRHCHRNGKSNVVGRHVHRMPACLSRTVERKASTSDCQ